MIEFQNPNIEDLRVESTAALHVRGSHFVKIQRDIRQIAELCTPSAVARIAKQRHPDSNDPVTKLAEELNDLVAGLEAFNIGLAEAKRAEDDRLMPVIKSATRRLFEVADQIDRLDRMIGRSAQDHAARCKRLGEAGLSAGEVEKLAPLPDVAAMESERAALIAERNALDGFVRTKDEGLLPARFVESLAAHNEVEPVQQAA